MSLLLSDTALTMRRAAAIGPLAPLAHSLAEELEPLESREIYFPSEKAVLSREGGRCARDGTLLEFDPFEPHAHRCPVCGEVYHGELHDRFWIYWYQLWLAERAVHAAVLSRLGVGAHVFGLAERILDGYCDRYATYPNVDNVLGPTRLFFSTYLESIWLLQICVAADLVSESARPLADRVRDYIVEPSRAIIAEYDEGGSNRQVWNDAALLAAARLLGDEAGAKRAVFGPSGIARQLETGLLADGTWYEGENYHLFAHRGLWYGVTLAEQAGLELPLEGKLRFERGFAAPFLTALPDFTLPSRRDSQYKISLRQWRIAEHCELGLARRADPILVGALARLYLDDVPRRETGRRTSAADVERNSAPTSLTRADSSWRALLCARLELPPLVRIAPESALLESQGLAVFRRDEGRAYVALDYGHSGGGHGHPDRLNVLVMNGDTRWLDDPGTGSYVDPTLHWYRSTLAHDAPLVNGASQTQVDGTLSAYEETNTAGWIEAMANGIAPGARATRTIVAMPDYILDELRVSAPPGAIVDLPLHADVQLDTSAGDFVAGTLEGGTGLEDGFRFLRDTTRQVIDRGRTIHGIATAGREQLSVWARSDGDTEWWRARAAGPPGTEDAYFRVLRTRGSDVRHRLVLAWSPEVISVEIGDDVRVSLSNGTVHTHRRTNRGWSIDVAGAPARIELGGRRPVPTNVTPSESHRVIPSEARDPQSPSVIPSETRDLPFRSEPLRNKLILHRNKPQRIELGEEHYRRSESSWRDAGSPTAIVTLIAGTTSLSARIAVPRSDQAFAMADAVNRYDNEQPDINGDGVQLHILTPTGPAGWMLVPERGSTSVRVRPIGSTIAVAPPRAAWKDINAGYELELELSPIPDAIDVIVNEMPAGRARRRGQLVLSGSHGDFVYLRGDRQDVDRLLPLVIDDV